MKRIITCLFLFVTSPALAADYPGRVVGVSDGDTLTVLRADKTQVRVRLHGIDAPETGQQFGSRAKQAASGMAFGKDVTIREVDKDRYGRTVADVILPDSLMLNRELAAQGYAWWYNQYAPDDRELERLEAEARAGKRGLWGDSNPVAPWDWRHGVNLPITAAVVGNRNSHLYHAPHCRSAGIMKPMNRVEFVTASEAEKAGYRKAKDCK